MRYIGRLIIYLVIFLTIFTVSAVVALRFVPVTVTTMKIEKLFKNRAEHGWRVRSQWVPLSEINIEMQKAVVATEDNNFLQHRGFDFEAIRLAIEERKSGKRRRGASTISQQTAKNLFCTTSQTWFRKGVESYFTVLIEALWNKQRIMEVYLNSIETHPTIYGVEETAQYFYHKPASKLNNYDAAMITTVLPSPARMNIAEPSNYMVRRSTQVRRLMRMIPPLDYNLEKEKTEENKN